MAKFSLQPHPGSLISFIRVAVALSGRRACPSAPHSLLAGARFLRKGGLSRELRASNFGELGISGELQQGQCWSPELLTFNAEECHISLERGRVGRERGREGLQLGEASLAMQGAVQLSSSWLLALSVCFHAPWKAFDRCALLCTAITGIY